MAKPERIEDLGRISAMITSLIDEINESWGRYTQSKHTIDTFVERYGDMKSLEELHDILRWQLQKIDNIHTIAAGYDYIE